MIEVGSSVKDKITGSLGRVVEIRTVADGHSARSTYLVETQSGTEWRDKKDIMEYLTNDGSQSSGQFLTEG